MEWDDGVNGDDDFRDVVVDDDDDDDDDADADISMLRYDLRAASEEGDEEVVSDRRYDKRGAKFPSFFASLYR